MKYKKYKAGTGILFGAVQMITLRKCKGCPKKRCQILLL